MGLRSSSITPLSSCQHELHPRTLPYGEHGLSLGSLSAIHAMLPSSWVRTNRLAAEGSERMRFDVEVLQP